MKVNVFLPFSFTYLEKSDLTVGVDYGAYLLAKKSIMIDVAIGDFDSTSKEEFVLVKKYSKKIIKLKVEKNETDSEAAVLYLLKQGYTNITLIGDVGSRLDHFLINYRLVEKYDVKYILENSKIFNLKEGYHKIKNEYQFLSLFTSDACTLSLNGSKYSLDKASIEYLDLYTSANKIVDDYAIIEVFNGNVTVVLSNDK